MEQIFSVQARQYRLLIERIKMTAFRGFQNETEIRFEPDLTVFVAQNGGGKSSILDAIYEHLQILAKQTFLPKKYLSKLSSKDVNLNIDTFSEMSADFILDFVDADDELEVDDILDVKDKSDKFIAKISYTEFRGISIHSSFVINNEVGVNTQNIIDAEKHLTQIRAFNSLKAELYNYPVFKFYQPGEQSSKTTRKDFNDITVWMERCQKMAYQAGSDKKYELHIKWLQEAVSNVLQDAEYEYTNFSVKYTEAGDLLRINKKYKGKPEVHTFNIDQLSSGERALISIVADLAIEMIEHNPIFDKNPLEEGYGIVLIDEVDVHLHPEWQVSVVEKLQKIYPKIQFIITTHSPEVVKTIHNRHIRIIRNWSIESKTVFTYGRDTNSILQDIFGGDERLKWVADKIHSFYLDVETNPAQAQKTLKVLKEHLAPYDKAIAEAEAYLELMV
jgi:predicted ATP-binding protein involved in virulence